MINTIRNIQTKHHPVVMELKFFATTTDPVYFVASDQDRGRCVYFNREYIPVSAGEQSVELTLPISPNVAKLDVHSKGYYTLQSISTWPMKKQPFEDATSEDFMELAERLACKFQHIGRGQHKSRSGKFTANIVGDIRDDNGNSIPTPMQVDHLTADVLVNKNLVEHYTAQAFVVAMLHENQHYKYNTKDEIACDLLAAKIAVDRGYMHTEIMRAFTSVLGDDALSLARTHALDNFLMSYKVPLK